MEIQAELISIGNELLTGQTLNTHGRDLGEALTTLGLQLSRDTTIPDNLDTIGRAVNEAFDRVNLVFISGGLGPTVDDITRDALARLLNRKVVIDQPTVDIIKDRFEKRGKTINIAATRQAQVLEGAVVLPNSAGAAPGQRIAISESAILFVLPGPPKEFNAILTEEIIPWLQERYAEARPRLVRIVRTKGIGESDIVTILEAADFEPDDIDLGFYPGSGKVEIRLTAAPTNESLLTEAEKKLLDLLQDHLDPD